MIAATDVLDSEQWRNIGSLGAAAGLVVVLWRLVTTMQTSVIGALRQRAEDTTKDLHECEARLDRERVERQAETDALRGELARVRAHQIDLQGQVLLLTAQLHRLEGDTPQ